MDFEVCKLNANGLSQARSHVTGMLTVCQAMPYVVLPGVNVLIKLKMELFEYIFTAIDVYCFHKLTGSEVDPLTQSVIHEMT